jgi:riboflavin transporter FmnP
MEERGVIEKTDSLGQLAVWFILTAFLFTLIEVSQLVKIAATVIPFLLVSLDMQRKKVSFAEILRQATNYLLPLSAIIAGEWMAWLVFRPAFVSLLR